MLSDIKCKNAKAKEKPYKVFDEGGLFLYVNVNGSRSWRMRYKVDYKEYSLSFGSYPDISLKEARLKRDEARLVISRGGNPAVEKQEGKRKLKVSANNTFKALAEAWFTTWQVKKTEHTKSAAKAALERYVFPEIGHKIANELTSLDFIEVIKKVEAHGLGFTPGRLWQRCSQIMRFGIPIKLVDRNPLADIKPADVLIPHTTVNHSRISVLELPQLIKDAESYKGHILTRIAIKLMMLTFVRTQELIKGEWVEIDLKARLWRIPADRMKMKDDHLVPLSTQTINILKQLYELTGKGEVLFPGSQRARTISNNTIIYALYRMGYHSRMTGHGFRGLASTALHEMGFPPEHIELQLAHQQRSQVSAAYNHAKYLEQRRVMMQAWADFVDSVGV
ncbi:MAG: integrase arm-type DNA-binding domain-containing protein [Pseudomonadota bacterium]